MVSTKYTYNLKDIYGGKTYYIQLSKREDAVIIAKTLVGMGFKSIGSWPLIKGITKSNNVVSEHLNKTLRLTKYGMWVYPTQKVFEKKTSDLRNSRGKYPRNVFEENHFRREITYDIFRFVMVEKIFNNKNKTIWEEN